jgi:hypothetical protein
MLDIISSLNRIVKYQYVYYQNKSYLSPGLTLNQKQALLDGFPFLLTKELSDIFSFRIENLNFEPHFASFFSLEESLEQCLFYLKNEIPTQVLQELGRPQLSYFRGCFRHDIYQKAIKSYPHNSCMLPIAIGFCKEIYYVNCHKNHTEISPVWICFIGGNLIEYASSLTNLIRTIAECYEENAYYPKFHLFDEELRTGDWSIEEDLSKVESIFKKYNPNYINTWRKIWKN